MSRALRRREARRKTSSPDTPNISRAREIKSGKFRPTGDSDRVARAATMTIADEQDLARQRGDQHVSLPSLSFRRAVCGVGRCVGGRRVRRREVEGDKKGEMRTDAADSMSNLVVKTCTRERGREGRRCGVKTIFLLPPTKRRTSRVRRSRNSLLTTLAMNNCLPAFQPSRVPDLLRCLASSYYVDKWMIDMAVL